MVWGSNFKHSSVRLEETIYIKYLYYKNSVQWNINTWRQVQVWYHGEHQLENAYSPFRPFYITVFMGWRKRQIPLISPWLASVNFTKFRIPPPLSFELKTMSRIFPCPGAEKPIHPLVFPDIFPWLARGPTPGASRWHVHKPPTPHNFSIRSDEGLTLELSKSFTVVIQLLSTRLIQPNLRVHWVLRYERISSPSLICRRN